MKRPRLFKTRQNDGKNTPKPIRKLRMEEMECRCMMNAVPTVTYDPQAQMLTITGTAYNDTGTVSWNATFTGLTVGATSDGPMPAPPPQKEFKGHVKWIKFMGLDGNDKFTNNTSIPCEAYGGEGNDTLRAGSASDTLWGGPGADLLQGMGGLDYLYGEEGNDVIEGGSGNDMIAGGDGNDTLRGDAGKDVVFGGLGDDDLHGGLGSDLLLGGEDNDSLFGDEGSDELHGGAGNDWLSGGFDSAVDGYFGEQGADSFFMPIGKGIGAKTLKDYNASEDFLAPFLVHQPKVTSWNPGPS
jgi:Ca2+-binding RTX toxin-like protein